MSKRKDRANTYINFCPRCGRKGIMVWKTRKWFEEKNNLKCYNCAKIFSIEETNKEWFE